MVRWREVIDFLPPGSPYHIHPSSRLFPVVFVKDDDCVPPSPVTLNNSTDRIWTDITVECVVRRHRMCAGRQIEHLWKDWRCTCDVTLRRVRATIVALEKAAYYIFWVCVFSLRYRACNTRAPYILSRVRLYRIFPQLIYGTILENRIEHKMRGLSVHFCLKLFSF